MIGDNRIQIKAQPALSQAIAELGIFESVKYKSSLKPTNFKKNFTTHRQSVGANKFPKERQRLPIRTGVEILPIAAIGKKGIVGRIHILIAGGATAAFGFQMQTRALNHIPC